MEEEINPCMEDAVHPSEEFKLRFQRRCDFKWMKVDLQTIFSPSGLSDLWNELLKEKEILLPKMVPPEPSITDVCNYPGECGCWLCIECDRPTDSTKEVKTQECDSIHKSSKSLIKSWTWDPELGVDQLKQCLELMKNEQRLFGCEAFSSTLSATRLQQRLIVVHRYFCSWPPLKPNSKFSVPHDNTCNKNSDEPSRMPCEKPLAALAMVGCTIGMSFAFASLRRAWRSGEDADLCSELLQESLMTLRALPYASLFDICSLSPVWRTTIEQATVFLRAVVLEDFAAGIENAKEHVEIPVNDKQLSLAILLELAVQQATLRSILDVVLLLIKLWKSQSCVVDNRVAEFGTCAPLVPILKKFQAILNYKHNAMEVNISEEVQATVSPTEVFLHYMSIPEDDSLLVDMQQAAVYVLCNLDQYSSSVFAPILERDVSTLYSLVMVFVHSR
ncbi:E3 ubiquitin-protein ligase HERC2-like isoform X2 [Stegodyphus dumicola]|uniref:E3 ubiquitin-protein ligase HERC2-like isoform X2 n=1 Tax=Stegodyphus dumicola TaxID=202533 RepID=UPI0015AD5613|nr:E3 ubiquitin-protein ligase HERC2-like isoform X2 [Stegodyphus dumicola]